MKWACASCDHAAPHEPVCRGVGGKPCACEVLDPMLPALVGREWMFSWPGSYGACGPEVAATASYDRRDVVEIAYDGSYDGSYGGVFIIVARLRDGRWLCMRHLVDDVADDIFAAYRVATSKHWLWWLALEEPDRAHLADQRGEDDDAAEQVWLDQLLDSPDPVRRAEAEALAVKIRGENRR